MTGSFTAHKFVDIVAKRIKVKIISCFCNNLCFDCANIHLECRENARWHAKERADADDDNVDKFHWSFLHWLVGLVDVVISHYLHGFI